MLDSSLWNSFMLSTTDKLKSCYIKCMKIFFGYSRCFSVSTIMLKLGQPTLTDLLNNYRLSFLLRWNTNTRITIVNMCEFYLR